MTTYRIMNTVEITSSQASPISGNSTASTAEAEIIWDMTLINVPMVFRMEAESPAAGPNSFSTMPMSVRPPLCRRGPAKHRARIRHETPPPRVNHQALMP